MDKSERTARASEESTGSRILILCDFDGTVSTKDTVANLVTSHVTSSEWEGFVEKYQKGELGSKGVYEGVAPLMQMEPEKLQRFVHEHAALDPGFPDFLDWAADRGIAVKILSDGFDATIETLFDNHGIEGIEIFANRLILNADGRVHITSPHSDPNCGKCGTCKLEILRGFRKSFDKIILVGDGVSDQHAATEADLVLALGDLFVYCARKGLNAVRIDGFSEIPTLLERQVQTVLFDMDGTLIDSTESIAKAFNHMFSTLGYPSMTVEEVVRNTSMSLLDFVAGFLKPEETEDGIKIFRSFYDRIYLEETSMMPGAEETLHALDGGLIKGVITNKRGDYARRLADHFGFRDEMTRVIGAQDGFKSKPAGDMFHEFMCSEGSAPDATIYVGDSPIDIESAKNAGIDAFAVAGPFFSAAELASHGPRRVLKDISLLPPAIQPLI
jgi:2,3-diketo-5-methylthio-1-phosphopentane phosphatase/HAD superfamily hydrolase (TIGR01509 family)